MNTKTQIPKRKVETFDVSQHVTVKKGSILEISFWESESDDYRYKTYRCLLMKDITVRIDDTELKIMKLRKVKEGDV